jgi:hypothetical protein
MSTDFFKNKSLKFNTPDKVQGYIHSLSYNTGDTLYSAKKAMEKKKAHCLEGVFVAAALLERWDYDPFVLSLESQDYIDHCLFIYKAKTGWGAIGKSRDIGLAGREPRYSNLKNLVWSYFDPYVDRKAKILAWQVAHLDEIKCDWRQSSKNLWKLENHLLEIKHYKLNASQSRYQKNLNRYLKRGDLPPQKYWR